MTWPLGDEELLVLSGNIRLQSRDLQLAAHSLGAAAATLGAQFACAEHNSQQGSPAWDIKQVETTGSPSKGARLCGHPAEQSAQGPSTMVVLFLWPHLAQNNCSEPSEHTAMGRTCRYFLPCSECQKTNSKIV